jgi:hypothetical protein
MTNNTSTFTPSSLIQEAAEKESYFNPFITTLPGVIEPEDPEYQYAIQAMKQAGFDEAAPEITTSEVELIPTDSSQMTDNISIDPFMNPTFGDLVPDSLRPSTYVIGAGEHLQGNGWESLGMGVEAAGQTIRSFGFDEAEEDEIIGGDVAKEGKNVLNKAAIKGLSKRIQGPARLVVGAQGALEGYIDPNKAEEDSQTKIREAEQRGEGGRARTYHSLSPVTTGEEDLKAAAQRIHNDPNSTEAQKIISKVGHGVVYTVNRTVLAPVTFAESIGRFFVSIFDEDESEGLEAGGQENQTRAALRDRVFGSTPETLAPIDLNSSVVTDSYQQQNAPGVDFISGQTNQETEPYQVQDDKYAVLA